MDGGTGAVERQHSRAAAHRLVARTGADQLASREGEGVSATLSAASSEYVKVPVYGRRDGRPLDPTDSPVSLAFLTDHDATPDSGDWHAGEWETAGTTHYARVLVGPAGAALAADTYYVWVLVNDSQEIPVKQSDTLTVI